MALGSSEALRFGRFEVRPKLRELIIDGRPGAGSGAARALAREGERLDEAVIVALCLRD